MNPLPVQFVWVGDFGRKLGGQENAINTGWLLHLEKDRAYIAHSDVGSGTGFLRVISVPINCVRFVRERISLMHGVKIAHQPEEVKDATSSPIVSERGWSKLGKWK